MLTSQLQAVVYNLGLANHHQAQQINQCGQILTKFKRMTTLLASITALNKCLIILPVCAAIVTYSLV
jgi:hypothetical protein